MTDPTRELPGPVAQNLQAKLPVRRLLTPMRRFLEIESASGALLFACTVVALTLANSPWANPFLDFWHTPISVGLGRFTFSRPLEFWVNDGLMTIFFFVVGLEIKREFVGGELSEWRKASLPIVGAVGGMVAPALIYLLLSPGGPPQRGWGVPMATDIAFVVGVMALFGRRVPAGLKIFLLALAIADDIGAVLVIAIAYTEHLDLQWLYVGLGGLAATVIMNWVGVRRIGAYVAVGILVWMAFLNADVHPTVAGVILGLLTPTRPLVPIEELRLVADDAFHRLEGDDIPDSARQRALLGNLAWTSTEAVSPLERIEGWLHPFVGFVIMPIFALANAGVPLEISQIKSPVALAVAAGLILGKPLGIFTFSCVAIQLGIARVPTGSTWRHMLAAGCLGGIGFTMAIFVAGLAFGGELQATLLPAAKIGVFIGSVVSAVLGSLMLIRAGKTAPDVPAVNS